MDEEEVSRFVRVWGVAISSAVYCYGLRSKSKAGIGRAVLMSPVVVLFTVLPFALHTINLGAPTFFYLTWLGSFKVMLFALGVGPLASAQPDGKPLPLPHFVAVAILPIKIKSTTEAGTHHPRPRDGRLHGPSPTWRKIGKLLTFLLAVRLMAEKHMFSRPLVQVLYFIHVSLGIEILLAITAAPVAALLGLELEDQFRDPHLATSLQDFWGNRWNLMTSNILRLTVYNPMRVVTSPSLGKLGGVVVGIIASFMLSGLMHELAYYHYTRVTPTWEVTWFFILHGFCTAAEVVLKVNFVNKWNPPRLVSMFLISSFNASTATWLFLPQLLRNKVDERLLDEYFTVYDFLKSRYHALAS